MASNKLIYRQRCQVFDHISQATVIAMLPEGSRQRLFFEALDKKRWTITSFDPKLREVCIDVESDHGSINKLSVTLPFIDISPTDLP